MAEKKGINLNDKARELIELAQNSGVEQNFFFTTTFNRYQVQLNILSTLQAEIQKSGALVEKEYVKGRKNVYTHPAIGEYNKTAQAANQTVQTLLKIITTLADHSLNDSSSDGDEL